MTAISDSFSAIVGGQGVEQPESAFDQPKPSAPYEGDGDLQYEYRMSRQSRPDPKNRTVVPRGWSSETPWLERQAASPRAPPLMMSCINCRCSDKMLCAGSSDPVCSHCTAAALTASE